MVEQAVGHGFVPDIRDGVVQFELRFADSKAIRAGVADLLAEETALRESAADDDFRPVFGLPIDAADLDIGGKRPGPAVDRIALFGAQRVVEMRGSAAGDAAEVIVATGDEEAGKRAEDAETVFTVRRESGG